MIDFETWWNSSSADEFRRLNDDMDGRVVRPVWDAAIRATLSSQKATSAAPSPEATQPTQAEAASAATFDECAASGQSCSYGPHGPHGEQQCEYCGKPKPTQAQAPSEREALKQAAYEIEQQAARLGSSKFDRTQIADQLRLLAYEMRAALATQQAGQGAIGPKLMRRPGVLDAEKDRAFSLAQAAMYHSSPDEVDVQIMMTPSDLVRFATFYAATPPAPQQPEALAQQAVQAEPAAWQDPETLDVIASGRKADWMTNHGHGGRKKAVSYTTPLYATPPDPGRVARHDKTCASLLDGGAAGPCDCSAPGQVERDREDAERWRRLVNASEMSFPIAAIAVDPENDARMVYGRKRLEELIDQWDEVPNSYPARSSEGGGNEHSR